MLKMIYRSAFFYVVLAAGSSAQAQQIALFNGKNLEGWTFLAEDDKEFKLDDVWRAKDGVLICSGRPFGVLRHKDQFENYVLTLEWKWLPSIAGTSAVFVHTTEGKDVFGHPKSVEVSLFRDHAGDVYYRGFIKSLSDQNVKDFIFKRKTEQSAEKEMGEWNKLEMNCQGKTITVKVNGKQVNQVSDFPEPKGSICLQCRGTPIFFRNIKLAPMRK